MAGSNRRVPWAAEEIPGKRPRRCAVAPDGRAAGGTFARSAGPLLSRHRETEAVFHRNQMPLVIVPDGDLDPLDAPREATAAVGAHVRRHRGGAVEPDVG